jgi:hypothetical protein
MKCSIISAAAVMALLPALGAAGPITKRQATGPTADQLALAVDRWQADTVAVSSFLDLAPTFTDELAFINAAQSALNSENNELVHKAIIDMTFFNVIGAANNTLVTRGTFDIVVAGLQTLVNNGLAALNTIPSINQNRCGNVLPAIDMYFFAVENALTTFPGGLTIPVPFGGAVRPSACIAATK